MEKKVVPSSPLLHIITLWMQLCLRYWRTGGMLRARLLKCDYALEKWNMGEMTPLAPSVLSWAPRQAQRVQLLGFWPSPYSCRVIWALKLKGVNYEYVEEDFPSKSELLLRYNPVHKKIPVLVHRGKPIVESRVFLEYIEETWPENPLPPEDAYERAVARFWIQFGEDKGLTFYGFFRSTTGEAQEKSGKEVIEVLILEEQCLGDKMFFGGSSLGLVDISFGWLAYWFGVMEEVVGAKLFEPNTFPRLHAWAQNFKEISPIKENLPDRERLSAHFKRIRESFFIDLSSHNE